MSVQAEFIELGEGVLELKGPNDATAIDVGGTQGAELSYVPEFKDISIGQVFAAVKSVMIAEEGTFKVTLVESSMRNMVTAMGLDPVSVSSSGASDYIEFGGKVDPTYYVGTYTTSQIDDPTKDYVYTFYKMRAQSGLVLNHEKDTERTFEVTFMLFANADAGVGTINALGKISRER